MSAPEPDITKLKSFQQMKDICLKFFLKMYIILEACVLGNIVCFSITALDSVE